VMVVRVCVCSTPTTTTTRAPNIRKLTDAAHDGVPAAVVGKDPPAREAKEVLLVRNRTAIVAEIENVANLNGWMN